MRKTIMGLCVAFSESKSECLYFRPNCGDTDNRFLSKFRTYHLALKRNQILKWDFAACLCLSIHPLQGKASNN